ncbi:MAG: ATP-binding cassette domain-containing protein [Pseudomonadota bacterium]
MELFSGVGLGLAPGSFHFLTGPSGAGKTTLINLCSGTIVPAAGKIEVFSIDLAGLDRNGRAALRRRIGVVHQEAGFLNHLSVAENVALPLRISGRLDAGGRRDVEDLLKWVGLSARAHARPPELSGGERQRAALARAVILSPDLILADEPTGNVDWEMSQRLLALLAELNRMGKTVLVATHDLALIRASRQVLTDRPARVLRLAAGTLTLAGSDL